MKRCCLAAGVCAAVWLVPTAEAPGGADAPKARAFSLADHNPPADGKTDATPAFSKLFADVKVAGGGLVTIPPGTYALPGKEPIALPSKTRVSAEGAVFVLPEKLGDTGRVVLFAGENVTDFAWTGGEFWGHCFDPGADANAWEPNANTRVFLITTAPGGATRNVTFRGVKADGIAGAVVSVFGASKPNSESEVETFATDVTVADCTLLASGKFMWDYGFLWQITVWPEEFAARDHKLAAKYFPDELTRGGLSATSGDDLVKFDNLARPLPVAKTSEPKDALVFYGDALPKNVVRGKQYFVVASERDHIKVSDAPGGKPITFDGTFGPKAKLVHDHFRAFLALYAPVGSGPGKGALDLVACRDVRVSGCKLSARGDTMHIQKSRNVVFTGNHIVGSRMGAFFLAEYCSNATVTGNTIDGTNGSRVMSVEKSCSDVTITGNTFRNGGRGSWINQPTNFVLQGNVFVNNTTKCERDPKRGRRTFLTGDYETYPELYFTLHQKAGAYGAVVVSGNVFDTGRECAAGITFAPNGSKIVVKDNIFKGAGRKIAVDPSCKDVILRDNLGAE